MIKKIFAMLKLNGSILSIKSENLLLTTLKKHAKQLRLERTQLEDKLKHFEKTITLDLNENEEYNERKSKLEDIYQIKVDGIRTRSKCNWYEHGEKSSKFFFEFGDTTCYSKSNSNCYCQ